MSEKYQGDKKYNVYDRIFKENAESIFIPLIESSFGLSISSYQQLPTKISRTVEREMDLLYKVTFTDGPPILLHIEFQTKRDRQMLYRMAEYHGLALRKYQMPIRHIVIFLGEGQFNVNRVLSADEIFSSYDVLNISELKVEQLIQSKTPEMIILALLADFDRGKPELILAAIIRRLKAVCQSPAELSKFVTQLTFLSRLRNLELQISKSINEMSLGINVEEDGLYLKGLKIGTERSNQQRNEGIKLLLNKGLLTEAQVAENFNLTLEYVRNLRSEI